MSDINEIKSKAETMVIIGMAVNDTITDALRNLVNGWKASGEKSMKELVKDLQGKRFINEGAFILHAKKENVGLSELAVSGAELKEFQKLCKEYGVDFHFQKRPANLDDLFRRKQAGETLSSHQESVVNAFTIYDDKGVANLKSDSALITFKECDLSVMERILDKMDEKTYGIEQSKLKAKKFVEQNKQKITKAKEKFQKKDITKSK